MARMEFAILQYLEGKVRIVLKRDEDELLERLQARVAENLALQDWDQVQSKEGIKKAIDKAWKGLVKEFRDETINMV